MFINACTFLTSIAALYAKRTRLYYTFMHIYINMCTSRAFFLVRSIRTFYYRALHFIGLERLCKSPFENHIQHILI